MARTTAYKVQEVMETALTEAEINKIIEVSNRMVTNTLGSTSLAANVLIDIETYLTAHLIAIGKERQAISERINDIWITYQGKFGKGLEMTTFGQMVLILDTSGNFTKASKMKANISAIPQYPENYD